MVEKIPFSYFRKKNYKDAKNSIDKITKEWLINTSEMNQLKYWNIKVNNIVCWVFIVFWHGVFYLDKEIKKLIYDHWALLFLYS